MKRRILLVTTFLVALLAVFTVISVAAANEDYSWATLQYAYLPLEEGGEVETGRLQTEMYLERAADIAFDPAAVELKLDGKVIETSPVRLEKAGRYRIALVNKESGSKYDYIVSVKPMLNIKQGEVFNYYPTMICTNADNFCLDEGKSTWDDNIVSGDVINTLGAHELKIVGHNGQVFAYDFYVMVCTAEQVFVAEKGKEGIKLSVGQFEDMPDLAVYVDGSTTPLPAGESYVTGLGQHTITATANGAPINTLYALPSLSEMNLQWDLILSKAPSNEPLYFRFSRWDAVFYVDGKPVEGDYRLVHDGEHTIVAKDANGNVIENAFLIRETEDHEPLVRTEIKVTFNNPHKWYVLFVLVPALALLGVAGWFFLQRRKIV